MSALDYLLLLVWIAAIVYAGSPKLQNNTVQKAIVDGVKVPVRHERRRDKRTSNAMD